MLNIFTVVKNTVGEAVTATPANAPFKQHQEGLYPYKL